MINHKSAPADFFNANDIGTENMRIIEKYVDKPGELMKIKDLIYFFFAPTLCFQLHYPRTSRIRKLYLCKRIVEMVLVISFMMYIIFYLE